MLLKKEHTRAAQRSNMTNNTNKNSTDKTYKDRSNETRGLQEQQQHTRVL